MRSFVDRWPSRLVLAVAAASNVAALLAWAVGLGSFRTWFLCWSMPALVVLVVGTAAAARTGGLTSRAVGAGAIGGLAGTVGYDAFRVPFIAFGLRLFAPIDSYGVLLVGADHSSPLTGLAGWLYHLANGTGFGIAFALVGFGWRRRPVVIAALVWALALETATVLTPFADRYGLRGKWDLIGIAYAAHVAYGLPLGLVVARARQRAWRPAATLATAAGLLAVAALGMVAWLRPWHVDPRDREGRAVARGPSAVIVDGRFHPEWLRTTGDRCVTVRNDDRFPHRLSAGFGKIGPGQRRRLCPVAEGTTRVQVDAKPYSGGFLLRDPAG